MTQKETHKRRRKQSKRTAPKKRPNLGLIKTAGVTLALLILVTASTLLWTRGDSEPARAPVPIIPRAEAPVMILELNGLSAEAQTSLLREKAAELSQRFVTDFPLTAEAHMLQGNTFRQLGQSAKALACWRKALALAPRRADAFTYMAILAEEKEQWAKALEHWERVLSLHPKTPGVRDSLAHTLLALNRRDAAIKVLTEELKISPQSPRTHYLLGKACLQEKRFSEAIEFYEKALALDAEFTQATYEIATALMRSGRRQEAQHYRTQFQRRSKEQQKKDLYGFSAEEDRQKASRSLASLLAAAADLYQAADHADAGLSLLKQAVSLDPQNPETRRRLAARYQARGQFTAALVQCERIAGLEPNDVTCQMLIGSLSLELGRLGRAESAFQRMVSLAPENAYGYRELARLYLQTKQIPKEARNLALQAVTLEPLGPNYYILGLVCHRSGDLAAARLALQQALKHDPGNQAYQQALNQITLGR